MSQSAFDAGADDGTTDVRTPAMLRALTASPVEVAKLILELHRVVHDADSLLDLMVRASREVVRMFGDAEWAGVTATLGSQPFTAAHTDDRVLAVDEGQYDQGDGPCLLSARTDAPIAMTLAQVRERWPAVADIAEAVGVRSFRAEPLHAHAASVGSLNLYGTRAEGVRIADPDVLVVLVEYLERGLAAYLALRPEVDQVWRLKRALTRRHRIDTAVGALMAAHTLSREQAKNILLAEAGRRHVEPEIVATEILTERTAVPQTPTGY